MNDMMTEVRFWAQVINDMRQTVMCSPELESRVKTWIDVRGMGGVITVIASPYVPEDRIYIMPDHPDYDGSSRP